MWAHEERLHSTSRSTHSFQKKESIECGKLIPCVWEDVSVHEYEISISTIKKWYFKIGR